MSLQSLKEQLGHMVTLRKGMGADYRFCGNEDLVLQVGTVYSYAPIPKGIELPNYVRACFYNAYKAVSRRQKGWIYVEGFALNTIGMAIHHAWLTHEDFPGKAFDPTWSEHDLESNAVYMGIPFRREYVVEMHKRSKRQYFSVLDCHWAGWPLLTGTERVEDVIHSAELKNG